MPLLHFLKDRDVFASPTPLLLASVLYISALHHQQPELAAIESGYFAATCSAIAELVTPCLRRNSVAADDASTDDGRDLLPSKKDKVFHNILGLIMASLSSEAYIDATGSWIAIAYRLWLDHCPSQSTSSTLDWRGLFCGLQVSLTHVLAMNSATKFYQLIDLEHASMHMTYPLLPRQPPTYDIHRLDTHHGNAFQGLADMMHYGLSHFVGKGLPTIWCTINADICSNIPAPQSSFSDHDSDVIRLWARKLDDWLVRYNGTSRK